ncbi:hypothetical protein PTHTG4_09940 [Parageobacillus thermoglucosidasius]|nr:hypothetical protein PTHTG4_09940 [Parageobacillus thermoglucosidasius]
MSVERLEGDGATRLIQFLDNTATTKTSISN